MIVARCISLLAVIMVIAGAGRQDPSTAPVVERTIRYVEEYEKAFAAMVAEERQRQSIVRADGRVRQTRTLRSDFLLIKTGSQWAQVFRDVIEVDGKAVSDRAGRLRKLFLDNPRTAVEQARAIARESQRHNIGMDRQGNSPLLPLIFLHPTNQARSRFVPSGTTIAFEEVHTPTLLGTRNGSQRIHLPARGTVVVDPEGGRVLSAEFTAIGPRPSYSVSLAVRYVEHAQLRMLVPESERERYWFEHDSSQDRVEVESTYTNFRRFEVTTTEQIKSPR